eukprot:6184227-Pleurochrysis_carterae.AAC.1
MACLLVVSRCVSIVTSAAAETYRRQEDMSLPESLRTQVHSLPHHQLDHKTVTAPRAMGYQYILIVVYIPTRGDAYSLDGARPLVIKSDHGTAFRTSSWLASPSTHIFGTIIPHLQCSGKRYGGAEWPHYAFVGQAYSATSNLAVNDRYLNWLQLELGRARDSKASHTWLYKNQCIFCVALAGAQPVPMVTFALNCTDHLSLATSPFFALYGRHPISLPELENPHSLEATETGHEFVDSLALKLRQAWSAVHDSHLYVHSRRRMQLAKRILILNDGCS